MASTSTGLHRLKLSATCVAVALNAICANGVLTFPLMAPALAQRMKFTQLQLTSIVVAGMIGQYPLSPLIGKLVDYYGPWLCSLIASVLFSSAFSLLSWEFSNTPDDIEIASPTSFRRLVVYFAMAGCATAFSYFSALFAASKNFPKLIGMASGFSNVTFGMSPLFLSLLATTFYTNADTGLDVAGFSAFLALLCGGVNLFGTLALHTPNLRATQQPPAESGLETGSEPDETTSLLSGAPKGPLVELLAVPVEEPKTGSMLDLLKDPYFCVLFVLLALILGSCEMVISNIGTIVLSLPLSSADAAVTQVPASEVMIASQVRLLAISNTLCRLFVGPLADYFSPVASYLPNGVYCFTRKHHASRVLYLTAGAAVLVISFVWTEIGIRSQNAIWALTLGVGMVNGCIFTIIPGILSSIWGLENVGRNFGVAVYAPFFGTPIFSFLYSFVAESHSNGGICKGVDCWRFTFWVNTAAVSLAFFLSLLLWKKWRYRV